MTKPLPVRNADLLLELERSHALGKMTEQLGRLFLLLANNVSNRPEFYGYSYKEDMVGTAVMNLVNNWHKFDMAFKNPFAYFSQAVFNSFYGILVKEKNHQRIRDAALMEAGYLPSYSAHNPQFVLTASLGQNETH